MYLLSFSIFKWKLATEIAAVNESNIYDLFQMKGLCLILYCIG